MVKKMKVVKKALQKNVLLDEDYYTFTDIRKMYDNNDIYCYDKDYNEVDINDYMRNHRDYDLLIYLNYGDEVKISLDEYGYYKPVLIKNGKKYFIKL